MLDFPSPATTGQVFAPGTGTVYQWTGTLWQAVSQSSAGSGDFCAQLTGAGLTFPNTSANVILFNTIISGNLAGWYASGTGRWTPPAGRYCVYAYWSHTATGGATSIGLQMRKNGTLIPAGASTANIASANQFAVTSATLNVDMNGTDYVDIVCQSGSFAGVANALIFGAFPIPASGTTSIPSTSWRQLGRVVPTAAQPTVDFQNIPADINSLMFQVGNVIPVTNDVQFMLRVFDGTNTIDAGNNYTSTGAWSSSAAAVGATVLQSSAAGTSGILFAYNATNSMVANTAGYGISVDGNVMNIRSTTTRRFMTFNALYLNGAGTGHYSFVGGGSWLNTTSILSGLRFLFGASSNFAAGGAVTLWGSP